MTSATLNVTLKESQVPMVRVSFVSTLVDTMRVADPTSRKALTDLSLCTVGASTSHNPMGLHGLLQGQIYLKHTATCLKNVGASTSHNLMGLHGLLQG
jgi:hypothetical protein